MCEGGGGDWGEKGRGARKACSGITVFLWSVRVSVHPSVLGLAGFLISTAYLQFLVNIVPIIIKQILETHVFCLHHFFSLQNDGTIFQIYLQTHGRLSTTIYK